LPLAALTDAFTAAAAATATYGATAAAAGRQAWWRCHGCGSA